MASDPFITEISRHIWDSKYRFRDGDTVHDRTVDDSWRRIARSLASVEKSDWSRWENRFYDALKDFKFLPGGRIQAGAGTGRRVTLFNCFVMGTIEDSMDGIFDGLKEGALTMQQGGGVGYDFSTLRPRGTPAKSVGTVASGPVSFMQIWDAMCGTLLSTGARRGAMMATLRCDHPDIEAFIDAKRDGQVLRRFNLSVLVTDAFMEAMHRDQDWALVFPAEDGIPAGSDTVKRQWSGRAEPVRCGVYRRLRARELWDKLMRATYEYAEPGVLFLDRINQTNNLWYREQISATNPCVTADTWVHTTEGPRQVKELCGQTFESLVNGQIYRSSPEGFFSTGHKPILRLHTQEGFSLHLTGDHPVLRITRLTRWSRQTEWIKAGDLRVDDRVVLHDHRAAAHWPGQYGENEGYLLGLLIGDGTFGEGQAQLRAWPGSATATTEASASGVQAAMKTVEKITADFPHRSDFSGWRRGGGGTYQFLKLSHITRIAESLDVRPGNKTVTPAIERCSSDFYKGFLRGLFDTDGSVQGTQNKGISIRLSQSDEKMLESVQRMLLRLGIVSTIYRNRRAKGPRMLPDGRGGKRIYMCRADHELVISGDNLPVFHELVGFGDTQKQRRLTTLLKNYKRAFNREYFIATVEDIEPAGMEEVYDVQIPGINAFDANGFYVHNCGEIPLPPYGACDLGSINLTAFVHDSFTDRARLDLDAIRKTAAVATRMMDNVIDASLFPLDKQATQAQGTRHIGLGLTGLADTLIMLGLHYADEKARELAAQAMQAICHTAYRTSIGLAEEKGPFPFFEREKFLQGKFIQTLPGDIQDGIARFGLRNSHLTAIAPTGTISLLANNVSSGLEPVYEFNYVRRVLELDGSYSEHRLTDYALRLWRERHGDDKLPAAFVDTHALAPATHLAMQAALQPHVDNSISKTINVPRDYRFEDFKEIYERAYDMGLKGCTTFRPNPVTGEILRGETGEETGPHCCTVEREAD
jgi:ribonucleoside-diphosphate reductase alpha chain